MSKETTKRLLDAAAACSAVAQFTKGKSFSDYETDHLLRSAVERQFEIIGEALGKAAAVDPSLHDTFPAVGKIVALRNRLIHGYDNVDDEIMWDIVESKLPSLSKQLHEIVAARRDE
jgi:uncharacterized protein with HEPN domain